jgi:hypothetical protein
MVLGVVGGRKTQKPAGEGEATVLAATLSDGRALKQLSEVVGEMRTELRETREQRHSDSRAERDCMDSLTRAMRDNTEARHTGITPDMAIMLARLQSKG